MIASRPAATRRSNLFFRWFWMVYLPLGLLLAGFVVFIVGELPGWGVPPVLALAVWGVFAARLLLERRRRGLEVPPPRSLAFGIGAVAVIGLSGGILVWIGLGRVSSSAGVATLFLGGFLMLVALLAPVFKLVDVILRMIGRAAGGLAGLVMRGSRRRAGQP